MERKLQYIFMSVIAVLLAFAISSNLVMDINSRKEIMVKAKKILELSDDNAKLREFFGDPWLFEITGNSFPLITRGLPSQFIIGDIAGEIPVKTKGVSADKIRISFFKLEERLSAIVNLDFEGKDCLGLVFMNAKHEEGRQEWIPVLALTKDTPYKMKIEILDRVGGIEEKRRDNIKKMIEAKKRQAKDPEKTK